VKRFLLALLALAAAVAGAWFVFQKEGEEQRRERAETRLLQFDARQVQALTWSVDGVPWRFEKQGESWRLVSPFRDNADPRSIQRLLGLPINAQAMQVIDDPAELSDYGLDPPVRRLELEGVDAPALRVGNKTPTADAYFAQVEGRPEVLVLDFMTGSALQVHPELLREATLTGLRRTEVNGLDLAWGDSAVRLEREGSAWWIVSPMRLPASSADVERLLGAIDETLAVGFVDDGEKDDPRFGFEGATALGVVVTTPSESRDLTFGSVEEGLRFVRRGDRASILIVQDESLAGLPSGLNDLVGRALTGVNRYRVRSFEYRTSAGTLSAARGEDDAWVREDGGRLDDGLVYRLLVGVLEARVEDWKPGAAGGGSPLATLEFGLEDGANDRIEFFAGRRARVESLPDVTFVTAGDPPAIPPALLR
jgi:hypothetical protein